jgi:hypothetical protein
MEHASTSFVNLFIFQSSRFQHSKKATTLPYAIFEILYLEISRHRQSCNVLENLEYISKQNQMGLSGITLHYILRPGLFSAFLDKPFYFVYQDRSSKFGTQLAL